MIKSGIEDSANTRTFKYYDTTGKLVFIIERGGNNRNARMISPQIINQSNAYLGGRYFFEEYLSILFRNSSRFYLYIKDSLEHNRESAFRITDSIINKNYGFNLLENEFDNLLYFLSFDEF